MPNWAFTRNAFVGEKKDLEKFRDSIQTAINNAALNSAKSSKKSNAPNTNNIIFCTNSKKTGRVYIILINLIDYNTFIGILHLSCVSRGVFRDLLPLPL